MVTKKQINTSKAIISIDIQHYFEDGDSLICDINWEYKRGGN